MTYEPSAATAKRFAWAVTFCYAFRCLPSTRTAQLRQSPALAWPPCRDRMGGSARRWLISFARSRPARPEPVGDDRIAGPLVRLAVLRLAGEPPRGVRGPVAGPGVRARFARHVLAWERVANVPARLQHVAPGQHGGDQLQQ